MTHKNKSLYPREWDKQTIHTIFSDLDRHFLREKEQIEIMVIGGVAVVLQDFQNRSTNDIDLAPIYDADRFLDTCRQLGINAQTVTMASTVDFSDIPKIEVFKGKALTVFSVTAEELIRLKLERFKKQDPEDIYAIIRKTGLPYEKFVGLVKEDRAYFIGRPEAYLISAQVVVETMYPDKVDDFKKQEK